ncbi:MULTISPECIES: type II toxin-antitoxin system RelB/DinJ family antitoxin [Olsenella]|uniref:type II toxin-antitoxin system RelB/DinJ family antitoxin n=1 Tax=Olsenella TaxID=133925 RepID=UPI000231ED27|nr:MULTISPECIES: type II toxin-antitoxin system RelB/DinJ family antitoxin [Olsenella]EHF02069.1 hypothetical protein HMPREF1008_00999 [Olsenella sp. oral taxon 809 str. F0356]KXB62903.1 addiction module antitoxin, RelB/DinJ family [Olsenella sp. DNF00959]
MAGTLANAALSTKVTSDEKTLFTQICDSIGTSPSNALRMFVSAFNRRGGFPFDPSNPYGLPRTTLRAMEDAEQGRVTGPFESNEEMWASIFDDGE